MIKSFASLFTVFSFLLFSFVIVGCTSSARVEGKPVPEMTFAHISPMPIKVSAIEIENSFDPSLDERDVSSSFPTPPDVVLKRYAENRLEPAGQEGVLKVVIEDAHIYHSYIEPEGSFMKWARIGGKDRYDVLMKLRLYSEYADGTQSPHSILTMERYISVPESVSLAERELAQLEFLELLIQDVDKAIIKSLEQTLNLTSISITDHVTIISDARTAVKEEQAL